VLAYATTIHKSQGSEYPAIVIPLTMQHYTMLQRNLRERDREMLWGGRRGNGNFVAASNRWSAAMPQPNDLSRSLVSLDQNSTIIVIVELSQSSWLVAGMLPGIERQPRKKLEPRPERLLALLASAGENRPARH